MDIVNILFRANTKELDDAEKKLDRLGKSSEGAKGKVNGLTSSLDKFKSLGGPIGDVADRVSSLKDQTSEAASNIRSLAASAGTAAAALVVLAGVAGVIAALRFAGVLDDLDDLAAKLGLNATQALLVQQEMKDAGVSVEAFQTAIGRATKALAKGDEEGKAAAEALRALGIVTKDNTTPQELLNRLTEEYGKKLAEGTVSVDEAAALQLVLGKNYQETMIAVQAAQAAQERYNTFNSLGIGISKEGVEATRAYSGANKDLELIMSVVGSKLVGEVVPAFTGMINALVDSYKNSGLVKVGFDGIRFAAQLVMVPIRALFNAFIQLDAAITTVGKGLGAVFAAIATRSLEPFAALKEEVAAIWNVANSRTTSMWSWDSGSTQPTMAGNLPTGGNTTTPKKVKPVKTDKDPKEDDWKWNREQWLKGHDEQVAAEAAATKAAANALKELVGTRFESTIAYDREAEAIRDMLNPMREWKREIDAINDNPLLSGDEKIAAVEEFSKRWNDSMDRMNKKTGELSATGQLVFSTLGNSISDLVMGADLNFKTLARSFIKSLLDMYVQVQIIKPMMEWIKNLGGGGGGGFFGTIAKALFTQSANGNVFGSAGLLKSANGNVFNKPTMHAYSGGLGVLGEAGPEAILPLKRGAGGVLGVQVMGSAAGTNVITNNVTVNVQGGNSNDETGAIASQAVVKAMQGIADSQIKRAKRPGNLLNPMSSTAW